MHWLVDFVVLPRGLHISSNSGCCAVAMIPAAAENQVPESEALQLEFAQFGIASAA